MSDSIEVRACPECGQEIVYHCWHNGDDVSSVRMPITQAINLAEGERARLQQELKTNAQLLVRYYALVRKGKEET